MIRSLYGLTQSSKLWYWEFDYVILDFKYNSTNKCVYPRFTNDCNVIMSLYGWHAYIDTNMNGFSDTRNIYPQSSLIEVDTILGTKVRKHSGSFALC